MPGHGSECLPFLSLAVCFILILLNPPWSFVRSGHYSASLCRGDVRNEDGPLGETSSFDF